MGLHAAEGSAAGIAIASLLVLFNAGGMKDLILATGEPYVPLTFFPAELRLDRCDRGCGRSGNVDQIRVVAKVDSDCEGAE